MTSSLSIKSRPVGLFDLPDRDLPSLALASLSFRLSLRFRSSSGFKDPLSIIDDSELRLGRLFSLLSGLSSRLFCPGGPLGLGGPLDPLRIRFSSSWDRVGRWPGGGRVPDRWFGGRGAVSFGPVASLTERLLKSSSALVPNVAFLGDSLTVADMSISMADLDELAGSSSKAARNGFLDTGRLPLGGVLRAGEGITGDAALLRKGLLEEKLSESPGEGRRSGIDGSAIMIVPLVLSLHHAQSVQTSQEPEGRMRWSLQLGVEGFSKARGGWSHKIGGRILFA